MTLFRKSSTLFLGRGKLRRTIKVLYAVSYKLTVRFTLKAGIDNTFSDVP